MKANYYTGLIYVTGRRSVGECGCDSDQHGRSLVFTARLHAMQRRRMVLLSQLCLSIRYKRGL